MADTSHDARRSRRRWIIRGPVLAIAAVLALWAFVIGPRRLVVHRETLALPRWSSQHDGLKVALLSDLHVGSPHWGIDRLRELVERTNAEKPDLVLLAGDYVIDGVPFGEKVAPEPIAEVLGGLRAPLGVVAVLGNHDWWNDGERIRRALGARGIVVLENEVHTTTHAGAPLSIVGLADAMTRSPRPTETLAAVPEGATTLVLVHEPDVFTTIDDRPALTLAGHTHGGQVALPVIGRPIVPSAYGQKYAAGHVVEGGRHLFVTTGIGTSILPARFNVPPELVVLTLVNQR